MVRLLIWALVLASGVSRPCAVCQFLMRREPVSLQVVGNVGTSGGELWSRCRSARRADRARGAIVAGEQARVSQADHGQTLPERRATETGDGAVSSLRKEKQ